MPNANRPARFEGREFPQVIPEPDDVLAGAPAPWSFLDEKFRQGFTLAHVVERLRAGERHLDGWPVPGDPQEMEAVMDATSRPIVNVPPCCSHFLKKRERPTWCSLVAQRRCDLTEVKSLCRAGAPTVTRPPSRRRFVKRTRKWASIQLP
jgi:hypothetical protein